MSMPTPFTDWTVLSHGKLVALSDNLWHVSGTLPGSPLPRAMTVVRRDDGKLIIHNPIALDEASMKELEALGEVAVIVVPNRFHRMDARIYKDRYPGARVICPIAAKKHVDQVVRVDGTADAEPGDGSVSFIHLAGIADAEVVMQVRSEDGISLIFCDTLFNLAKQKGFAGFIINALGSTGGPKVTRIARALLVKDRAALKRHLDDLAKPEVVRLVPGHGDVVQSDGAAVLKDVAAAL